jgi:hypothetical protein
MKTQFVTCLISLAIGLSSCEVYSVHPLYTPKDLLTDKRLPGLWKQSDDSKAFARIISLKDSSYQLTYWEEKNKGDSILYEAHFLKLGNDYYLDLYPQKDAIDDLMTRNYFPVHSFIKLNLEGQNMTVYMFDGKKMIDLFKQNRIRLNHELLDDCVIITARTEDIQKFIRKYSSNKEAFTDPMNFIQLKK